MGKSPKKRPKTMTLSMSSIKTYLNCPKQWEFIYVQSIGRRTDYPRLCGEKVHWFIKHLYDKHDPNNRFYFKSIDTARKNWFRIWEIALTKNRHKILKSDKDLEDKFGGHGWVCISNYWARNYDLPDPLMREVKYTIPLLLEGFPLIKLTGSFDQVRAVKLPWLQKHRPEIFLGDELLPLYDPYLIVDLKTGWSDNTIDENDTDIDKLRKQFSIQRDIQAAAYALIYFKKFGKYPSGFYLYHLRNNKGTNQESTYFVKGDLKGNQEILISSIHHLLINIREKSYPWNIGSHCKYCDYLLECKPEDISISLPGDFPESILVENKPAEEYVQLELNFKKDKKK